MQIDIKGRNVPVTDELRMHAERRLAKVARQVSDLARLEIEIFRERNPRVSRQEVAECTLYLKGVTLRAPGRLARDAALAEPRRRRAGPSGQAPSRQTAPPSRGARGASARVAATAPQGLSLRFGLASLRLGAILGACHPCSIVR